MTTEPAPTPARRKLTPVQRRAAVTFFVVIVICGPFGGWIADDVVGELCRFANHDEFALRLIGWLWGGAPWAVATLFLHIRERLTQLTKELLLHGLIVWSASSALLIPGRLESDQERFGAAWSDSRPLGFGWACGFLVVFVFLFLLALSTVVLRKFRPAETTKAHLVIASRAVMGTWLLCSPPASLLPYSRPCRSRTPRPRSEPDGCESSACEL
ncbi:hypothetical protein OG394_25550 [Kribbella sp. NBC_01245]|uniref:hypothetical protein n=1 Tax=Kribbella sp. NBC_01245 TaxID=2903578 RepID=UPI002E2D493C|nr:hypothetical protein [Kribbella sp. NBC_01245]